jgi:ferredoxin-thioredoxin reductase catalytic subunit
MAQQPIQFIDEAGPHFLGEVDKARRMAEKYAARSGYYLNPDYEALEGIYRGLARNKLKYGHRYCP